MWVWVFGLEMTTKTEESHHSMSREHSIQPVTRPSGAGQEVGVPVLPCQGSYDLIDVTLRDTGNTLNITSNPLLSKNRDGLSDITATARSALTAV